MTRRGTELLRLPERRKRSVRAAPRGPGARSTWEPGTRTPAIESGTQCSQRARSPRPLGGARLPSGMEYTRSFGILRYGADLLQGGGLAKQIAIHRGHLFAL